MAERNGPKPLEQGELRRACELLSLGAHSTCPSGQCAEGCTRCPACRMINETPHENDEHLVRGALSQGRPPGSGKIGRQEHCP